MPRSDSSHELPALGHRVGEYVIEEVLGQGGMGTVYVARHPQLGVRRALKVQRLQTPTLQERFAREARSLAKVDRHPGVVRIHEHGWLDEARGSAFVVMDLVEGPSLAEELEARGPLSVARASLLLARVAEALAHIHAAGLVHRDLKPENVLLRTEDDQPLLTDFGLALDAEEERLTQTGGTVGTAYYMSPEQIASSHHVDAKSDVFALGVILYELLAGERPFEAESHWELFTQITSVDPEPLVRLCPDDVPAGVSHLVARMLAKTPGERPSAAEVAAALHRVAAGEALEAPSAPARSWLLILGAVALVVLVALVGVASSRSSRAPAPASASGAPVARPSPTPRPAAPSAAPAAERRRRVAAAQAAIDAGRPVAAVLPLLRACVGSPGSRSDEPAARRLVTSGLRYLMAQQQVEGSELVALGEVLGNQGVWVGRDPLAGQLLPLFTSWYARLDAGQLGRVYVSWVRLDLPLDMVSELPPRALQRLPDAPEARFLALRDKAFGFSQRTDDDRRRLWAFLEAEGDALGPVSRAQGLWLSAGIEDVSPAEHLARVRAAQKLDPQSEHARASLGVALARAGQRGAAKQALDRVLEDRRGFSLSGSVLVPALQAWGYAYLGDREGLLGAQRAVARAGDNATIRELLSTTTRLYRSVRTGRAE